MKWLETLTQRECEEIFNQMLNDSDKDVIELNVVPEWPSIFDCEQC